MARKKRRSSILPTRNCKHLLDWPIIRREDLDGIKVYLGDVGWVMVRASGTEHMLRIYSETTRPETTAARARCRRSARTKIVSNTSCEQLSGAVARCKNTEQGEWTMEAINLKKNCAR